MDADTDALATQVVDASIKVHKTLGPGLLESVYEACLAHELTSRGVQIKRQLPLPISYDGMLLDAALRLDLVVGDRLIVELKSVETLLPIHQSQLMTYLKLSGIRLGLLINFNTRLLRDGIKRIAF
ncbi:MAG: GxxExxY protein [Rhodocyclales bacterium]|nr:GxxExxY protein [Rhodocyclales bacterium]